ncbi:hypothetical protein EON66_10365 [archaeon]|nr:MAG: hypothetical protein EON66_10365 [archaeon]
MLRRKRYHSWYRTFAFVAGSALGLLPTLVRAMLLLSTPEVAGMPSASEELTAQLVSVQHAGINALFAQFPHLAVLLLHAVMAVATGFACTAFFLAMAHAEGAYSARLLIAKYFTAITSIRRAARANLPHFRLHKVANIKMWLTLRSVLRVCCASA